MSADLLRRAAKTLRKHADLATAGPWHASPVDSPRSHMNSALYSHAHPTGTAESEVVGTGRKARGAGIRNPHNARYFELMHPPVALELAELLEAIAVSATYHERDGFSSLVLIPGWTQAVKAARAILREGDRPRYQHECGDAEYCSCLTPSGNPTSGSGEVPDVDAA